MIAVIIALIKKLKIKLTWKSIVAMCVLLLSIISIAVKSGVLPVNVAAALGTAAVVLLALERIAEAMDNTAAVHLQIHRESLSAVPIGFASIAEHYESVAVCEARLADALKRQADNTKVVSTPTS